MRSDGRVRTATDADVPGIRALQNRAEEALGGDELFSDAEVAEQLELVNRAQGDTLIVEGADGLLGAAWRWRVNTFLLIDPQTPGDDVHHRILEWLEEGPARTADVDSRDARFLAVLSSRGWRHARSAFDLGMDAVGAAALDEPGWPHGLGPRTWVDGDAAEVHDLIYARAGWADVPGHSFRDREEWQAIFTGPFLVPTRQVVAVDGDRVVGVAMTRIFDDGTGWVSQLAVDRSRRGLGLGRSLLLSALHALRDAGAPALGLSVSAENRSALGLYRSVGLTVSREWLTFAFG